MTKIDLYQLFTFCFVLTIFAFIGLFANKIARGRLYGIYLSKNPCGIRFLLFKLYCKGLFENSIYVILIFTLAGAFVARLTLKVLF